MQVVINKKSFLKSLFLLPYFGMILAGLMLPSDGNHSVFAPKSVTFIGAFTFTWLYFLFKKNHRLSQVKLMGFTFAFASFLLLWLFLGITQDPSSIDGTKDQFKLFVITLSFAIITLYLVSEDFLTPQKVIRVAIFANVAFSSAKLSLVVLHLAKIIDMWKFLEKIGIRFMSMEVAGGFSRFQTSVDIITPFLIFFVLQSKRLELGLSKKFIWYFCTVSIISTVFSFSRFLMGVAFMSFFLYWMTLNLSKLSKALTFFAFVIFITSYFVGFEVIAKIVERRFFSHDNDYSDLVRVQQIEALLEEFFNTPYIGNGLGGHAKNLIRDGAFVHSYEVQWVAFLMQFGLIGIVILIIPLVIIASKLVVTRFTRLRWGFFGMFLIWLFSGFTNPFMISLQSGIIYTIFLLAAMILNNKDFMEEHNKILHERSS